MAPFLYFDPGTGALAVQLIAAAGAAIALFYRRFINAARKMFGAKPKDDLLGDINVENETDAREE